MAFTYPWFLLALLTVLIPVAIHLFELRRPKRVLFTNVGFIQEIKLITARQRRLKHLLVLMTRIGFLVFMVLLFAQPYVPAVSGNEKSDPQAVVRVVVDTTPSMQAGDDEQSVFDQAIKQARELPTAYPTATNFVLPPKQTQSLTASAYQTVVDKLQVSGSGGGLSEALGILDERGPAIAQSFIISDFQKNTFSANTLAKLDSTQKVFLVPVGAKEVKNVFVDSVWLDDAFVRSNVDVIVHIRLRNGGDTPIESCQVKLFIGDKQAAAFRTAIPLSEAVSTEARVRLEGEGLAKCRIELEDLPVTFDNSFYFTLQPSARIKVLDVLPAEATATRQLYANEPLFSYTASRLGALDYRMLEAADVMLVQAQTRIDAGLRESMKRVVQRGGALVIVPPIQVEGRTSYDQLFRELGVGPVQWERAGAIPVLRDVAMPSTQNPFFKDVFGAQNRQPVMPKASPVLRWSRSGADLMRMRDGDGFLSSYSSGRGNVYLFSTPFDDAYSDFTQHALFVPVMYRLAMQSARSLQQPAYRLNQGTIAVNVPSETMSAGADQVFKLVKDSLTFIPGQQLQAGVLRFDVPPGMREQGFYRLTHNGRDITTIAFNFDKQESRLDTYSAAELRQLIGPNRPNVQVYDASAGQSVAAKYKAEQVGTSLWQYCLWAALACLLTEVLLLRFVGKAKTAETRAVAA
ncbi:BatA domain-containing protein [Hymenobacter tibetensis]|uniref:BatA domain-containing protein n=1 Tax=Hymenobacter tibetensis TaxID=497967 RepID=A0ABY4CUH3_9BACT|nr:BatA domain-containing protein [Hymenobacter tibetensis]UOG73687.1 BatA domain-containing protein [Hymenobacter tibetensis]